MRVVLFCHSLRSCWNHGNAHFLRGVVWELMARGHEVCVYEPRDGWSLSNLVHAHGTAAMNEVARVYPGLDSVFYDLEALDLDRALDRADLVLVHEWSPHALVARIGAHRARTRRYRLLFHDTHHRAVTDPAAMAAYDLRDYDGVLAFGRVIRDIYLDRGWAGRAWTWHEAADVRVFRPLAGVPAGALSGTQAQPVSPELPALPDLPGLPDLAARTDAGDPGDLVWIGNWGDDERTAELEEFLLAPVRALGLRARVHGVRYPADARRALDACGIEHGGWLPNHRVPRVMARFRATVHIPRRPYARALPGIPTIRPFEALACGVPLVCSPWDDAEHLFTPGQDFLVARDRRAMMRCLRAILADPALARSLAERGLHTIRQRHTCGHRVDELLGIMRALASAEPAKPQRRVQ